MGVKFVTVGGSDSVVAIARNTEREVAELIEELADDAVDVAVEAGPAAASDGVVDPVLEDQPSSQEDDADE
jgi:hypothetical protein